MKIAFLIVIYAAIIFGVYYFVLKFHESNEKEFTKKKKLIYFITITIILFANLTNFMALFNISTTTIAIYNGTRSQNLEVTINGKKLNIKAYKMETIQTSNFRNKIFTRINSTEKTYNIKTGTYIGSFGNDYQLYIQENRYKTISGDFTTLDDEKFEEYISNDIIKIDDRADNCVILAHGMRMPKYVNIKFKGKRLFTTELQR